MHSSLSLMGQVFAGLAEKPYTKTFKLKHLSGVAEASLLAHCHCSTFSILHGTQNFQVQKNINIWQAVHHDFSLQPAHVWCAGWVQCTDTSMYKLQSNAIQFNTVLYHIMQCNTASDMLNEV